MMQLTRFIEGQCIDGFQSYFSQGNRQEHIDCHLPLLAWPDIFRRPQSAQR